MACLSSSSLMIMGVVAEISDRTVVMYRGDAVETGTTHDLFGGAKHPYSRWSLGRRIAFRGCT